MAEFFYVYVGQESTINFEIGEARGVWGWRSDALDQRRTLDRLRNREIAQSIRAGDYLVFGYCDPPGRAARNTSSPGPHCESYSSQGCTAAFTSPRQRYGRTTSTRSVLTSR